MGADFQAILAGFRHLARWPDMCPVRLYTLPCWSKPGPGSERY